MTKYSSLDTSVKLYAALMIVTLGSIPQSYADTPTEAEIYAGEYLLPLISEAQNSFNNNPVFYPHGNDLDPIFYLATWLNQHDRMEAFGVIPIDKTWEEIDDPVKDKFINLVNEGIEQAMKENSMDLTGLAPISEIWANARANPSLAVECCGRSCRFKFRFGAEPNISHIELKYYETDKSCMLHWQSTTSTVGNPYTWRSDENCDGDIQPLPIKNDIINLEFQVRYRELLKSLDPTRVASNPDMPGCDT